MDDTEALLSIGAFARRVGLAPSALRFYDDCDVLRPAHVDEATGYRYYDPAQEQRAVLVRRLREAGLPLTDASVVLHGTHEEAREILEGHARRTRDMAAAAQSAIEEVLRDLPDGARRAEARIGGAELSSAVRQVAPAVAVASVREEFPVLGCILIELDDQEVRLVATDRYRLAVRVLRPSSIKGRPCHVLVDAAEMKEIAAWAIRQGEITLELDGRNAQVRSGAACLTLPVVNGTFPSHQMITQNLPAARNRLVIGRDALRKALVIDERSGPITLRGDEHQFVISSRGSADTALPAICTGPPLRVAFDPYTLLSALDAGVGPDVLLEISSPDQPVVVRSADQGSFTTLVMPVHDTDG
jgi:DNA-binding transcriptional MerR regulator